MMENSGPTLEFLLSWVKDGRNLIIWDRDNWAQPNPNERAAADLKKLCWVFESTLESTNFPSQLAALHS